MTEPKEEKCEACCGSGYINFWTDDGHISMRTCRRCDGYGYIKVKQMTNEEWIKYANTEQLADKLTDFSFWIVPNLPKEDKREQVRKWIENWLKEKHDEM